MSELLIIALIGLGLFGLKTVPSIIGEDVSYSYSARKKNLKLVKAEERLADGSTTPDNLAEERNVKNKIRSGLYPRSMFVKDVDGKLETVGYKNKFTWRTKPTLLAFTKK